jgi:parallel beta-helix repeat protein
MGLLLPARAVAQGTTRIVDDDGRASSVSCEAANPAPRSIQAAINLSVSGDTILVCPGVYREQLKIAAKSLTIRSVTTGPLNQVLISPSAVVANSTNAFSGDPVAAVIAVENSDNVGLLGLTVDGADNRLPACAPGLVGIFYRNSSGEIQSTTVRNIRFDASVHGCQTGFGIFAQSSGTGVSRLSVTSSSVHDYQKAGIIGNETGTELRAIDNTVAGEGVTTLIAQNGIQVGFGATGLIARNSVVNHVFTCPTFPCDASTNILVYESNSVSVRGNRAAKAVIGIYVVRSDGSEIRNNRVSDSDVFDGIAVSGDRNHIHLNRIVNSEEFALSVEGDDNVVEKNVINDAPCGIFSTGAGNSLLDNASYNTELTTCEPFTLFSQAMTLISEGRSGFTSALALDGPSIVKRGNFSGLAVENAPVMVQRDSAGLVLRSATPAR